MTVAEINENRETVAQHLSDQREDARVAEINAQLQADEEAFRDSIRRQSEVDYLFGAVNRGHNVSIKLYDAETGKATAALRKEPQLSYPYLRGMLMGLLIGVVGILAAEFLIMLT